MNPFDRNGDYVGSSGQTQLRQLVTKGVGATVLSSVISVFIQMGGTLVLGRLLTPGDFGLVAMVTSVSMLLMNFGLNGFTEGVVQAERINHQLLSNLFWVNVGTGAAFTLTFAAMAPVLAEFFHEPKVAPVAVAMSATILLSCTSVLHSALLKKAMRFSDTSMMEILSRATYTGAAIVGALMGWGFWALVAAAIAGPLVSNGMAFWYCRWIPSLPRRQDGTRRLLVFAVNIYARYCVNYFGMTVDQLLIGRRFSTDELGLYKKAYDLFFLASGVTVDRVTMVAVAALSRLRQDPERFLRHYLNAVSVVAFVGMGIGAALSLVGKDIIRVVLGTGWDKAGAILMLFGFGTGMMFVSATQGWLHLSLGRADRWFRWGLVELAMNALLFSAALRFGAVGIAGARATGYWLMVVPALWFAGRPVQLRASQIIGAVWRYALGSAIAGGLTAGALSARNLLPAGDTLIDAIIRIVVGCAMFCLLYLASVSILNRGVSELRNMLRLFIDMLPARPTKPSAPAQ